MQNIDGKCRKWSGERLNIGFPDDIGSAGTHAEEQAVVTLPRM